MTPINIPGYCINEELYNGSRTIVYRGYREQDSLPVVIKLLKNPYPSFSELVQFRHQYTIAKNLNYPGIIQTYSLEPYQNGYVLIMEDFGGISLSQWSKTWVETRYIASLAEFLEIACAITDILNILYQERIIHKDIKPSNILINPETKQIKLIDFSIASLLPRDTQSIINPNSLEGTLAYISPEQTGRMNRLIDYRTDYYSLGVTFYELLTGELPFLSEDAMELVHCHIAKMPNSVNREQLTVNSQEIPQVLDEIIQKLMAKNAEDRYQSAWGLKYDLEQCLAQLTETGKINYFKIAQKDVSDRFIIPDKLYGRETEIQTLLDAFERVSLGTTEMMLVAGFSGIGKTAVINEVHKPIVRQRGYFIKGKYEQFNRNIPLSAFVQAFQDLMGQFLTENEAQIQQWKHKILAALGENGQVIIEVIPELERIIGKQPPVAELSGTAAQNRFNLLFQKFVQVFTTKEHPLVMFLDDLQWADSASLNLLKLLLEDAGHLLILGAYRDNEVSPVHPLILTVDEILKTGATVNVITLSPLSKTEMNKLVADTLNCEISLAYPLTELIYQKTQGNPFFAAQFLKALHDEKLIKFNGDIQHWQCDIAQIEALALTDDVVEFMALQLQKLPQPTQEILKLAACIGTEFDLHTLAIVSEKSSGSTATALWKALQEGLVIPTSKIYKFFTQLDSEDVLKDAANPTYRFLHDRIQQAAYLLIPEHQKQATHLKIGRTLLAETPPANRGEQLFLLVNQLNLGRSLLTQSQEQITLAQLNLEAGRKAIASTAYEAAVDYCNIGINLLPSNCWEQQENLTRQLYQAAAQAACLCRQFQVMDQWIDEALEHSPDFLAALPIQEIRLQALKLQSCFAEALTLGLLLLEELGITFPAQPQPQDIFLGLQEIQTQLAGRSIQDLLEIPPLEDPYKLAASYLLLRMCPAAFSSQPAFLPLLVLAQTKLGLESGHAAPHTHGYVNYAILVSVILGDQATASEFGELALQLIDRYHAQEMACVTIFLVNYWLVHWHSSVRQITPQLQKAYALGVETGDYEHASYSAFAYCNLLYLAGTELPTVRAEMEKYAQWLERTGTAGMSVAINQTNYQTILCLQGEITAPILPANWEETDLQHPSFLYYVYSQVNYSYLSNDYHNAQRIAPLLDRCDPITRCLLPALVTEFYAALADLALYPSTHAAQQPMVGDRIQSQLARLQQLAHQAPMNFQHKYDLVQAEFQSVLGDKKEAIELYDRAISGAKENDYIQEEALANELAAKFYLDWGKEKVAQAYMQEAYYCYARWGAKAKTDNLEKRYPQLLKPILQQRQLNLNPLETIATIASTSSTLSSQKNSTNISDALDFTSVLKAAQTISRSIELDELLTNLTKIILENSGAKKAVLILPQEDTWQIRATTLINHEEIQTILESQSLDTCQEIPKRIINYVKNTQETVIIDKCQTNIPGLIGEYMLEHQPKSILCTPMVNQGLLLGILYLENQLTSGVFTNERMEVIKLLAAQAAISLANAQLYQQIQQALQDSLLKQISIDQASISVLWIEPDARILYVNDAACKDLGYCREEMIGKYVFDIDAVFPRELWAEHWQEICEKGSFTVESFHRHKNGHIFPVEVTVNYVEFNGKEYNFVFTKNISDRKQAEAAVQQKSQELEKALQDLQQAQLQIVQNEKMSALGNLVAGVAHEMNNPLGFIYASLHQAKPILNDIIEHLRLYQENFPNPSEEIIGHSEEIDLDYSLEDLPKMIDGMAIACDRLKNISTSLRTFSRADQDYKVPFNIHEGIDSTILILKHRLKANDERPAIEVITEYGNLPKVACFPGQLNQVFMNIIANAIDALDEFNIGKSFEKISANPNKIIVKTSVEDNDVKITISDNANGMSEEVQQKIFDHLFTTKPVGKGTGLGLAIAKQIVEETHGGKLTFNSVLNEGTEFIIKIPV